MARLTDMAEGGGGRGQRSPHAIVVGAGFGGLASALRLRAKGYRVTVLDRAPRAGGRAQVFERDGYRHDAGPTVITAPFLLEELFALFGERLADHLRLVALDPWYRFRFDDGDCFDYGPPALTEAEIRRIHTPDVDGYRRMVEASRRIFEVGFEKLADQPFNRLGAMLGQVGPLLKLRSDRTVWQFVCRHLQHPKLRQAFSIQPLLLGGNPFTTTSIYSLIHYLERQWGVHFAMGGTGAIVDALTGLMHRQQISLSLNTTVAGLETEGDRVVAVRLDDGRRLASDLVVYNGDPAHLYRTMLSRDQSRLSARLKARHSRFSMGLYVLYFGTRRQYPDVAHHTIWLGPRYKALLRDIFQRKVLAEDFSLYLHRPTATDSSFAPAGHDSFYVLCPVPNGLGGIDWATEAPRLRQRILAALEATSLPGLSQHIEGLFEMTPDDFSQAYLSVHGAGFSIAPHFTQSAWFRFHNQAEGPANLYLAGAGTHPGAGVPGVLSSAKVLDRLIPSASAMTLVEPAA